jgi:hypothetical protein
MRKVCEQDGASCFCWKLDKKTENFIDDSINSSFEPIEMSRCLRKSLNRLRLAEKTHSTKMQKTKDGIG